MELVTRAVYTKNWLDRTGHQLGPTPAPDEVEAWYGNQWTYPKCDECLKRCDQVIGFGTVHAQGYKLICGDCLIKALNVCEEEC